MGPIPVEVRQAAVTAYLSGEGTRAEVAAQFDVSVPSLSRWVALQRNNGSVAPKAPVRHGPAPKLDEQALEWLRELATADRQASRDHLAQRMAERLGKPVSVMTIRRGLRKLGIWRKRPTTPHKRSNAPSADAVAGSGSYRYTEANRPDSRHAYPSDLSDAEWALLEEHFVCRTRPFDHPPRELLNAILYVLRAGCAWRMLPHDFPPWDTVYAAFRRWSRDGRLERAHEALRRRMRRELGRDEHPSALIIDSQSVKTTEKGGLAVTTQPRKPRGGSDISW